MGIVMVIEDLVKNMYWWMRNEKQGTDGTGGWWKVFGYVWVWAYLGWSLPKLIFPSFDCTS